MGRGAENIRVFLDTEDFYHENSKLSQAIRKTQAATVLYGEDDYPEIPEAESVKKTGHKCEIRVTKHRSYEAAMNLHMEFPDARICVLNFASAVNPGGGVKSGSSAQEEGLCRCSTLYPCLNRKELWEGYYDVNRAAHNPLNSDACIYTPGIVICKTDTGHPERMEEADWVSVDVISCAAPNLRDVPANRYNPQNGEPIKLTDSEQYDLHLQRAKHILHAAAVNREDILVLGAFGCGAFRNNPVPVAKAFHDALKEYRKYFRVVEFAVFCKGYETRNYDAFKREFRG